MIDRDRFFVTHDQHVFGNNTDFIWNSPFFGMENRLAAQLQVSRNDIKFGQEGNGRFTRQDAVSVINPDPGLYGPMATGYPKQPSRYAGGIGRGSPQDQPDALVDRRRPVRGFPARARWQQRRWLDPAGQPFAANWTPVSYRAAYTFEPIKGLMFYSLFATAYDPAAAGIFSISPGNSLALTSAKIYETGVKHLFWDNRAEWTFAAYDITRNNVYVAISHTESALAGEIRTKGIELAGAVRPIDDLKLWGNVALTQARYANFDFEGFTGNTPADVAPVIVNAGASYRFSKWRWPVEFGGSVRHVGNRYLYE